jgi:hypothetical protein
MRTSPGTSGGGEGYLGWCEGQAARPGVGSDTLCSWRSRSARVRPARSTSKCALRTAPVPVNRRTASVRFLNTLRTLASFTRRPLWRPP